VQGVANGTLTVGDTILFLSLLSQLYAPLNYFGVRLPCNAPARTLAGQQHELSCRHVFCRLLLSQYPAEHARHGQYAQPSGDQPADPGKRTMLNLNLHAVSLPTGPATALLPQSRHQDATS